MTHTRSIIMGIEGGAATYSWPSETCSTLSPARRSTWSMWSSRTGRLRPPVRAHLAHFCQCWEALHVEGGLVEIHLCPLLREVAHPVSELELVSILLACCSQLEVAPAADIYDKTSFYCMNKCVRVHLSLPQAHAWPAPHQFQGLLHMASTLVASFQYLAHQK